MLYPPSGLPDFTQAPPGNSSQAPALPIQLIAGSPRPALSFFRYFLYNFAVDVMRNGRKRQCGGNDELRRSARSHDES